MNVLIADDSQTIVDVLQFLLQHHGYTVITATDGIEAIVKTYQHHPDLLLLDVDMPRMNGYQVCRLLKSDEQTNGIPIVMLTSKGQQRDRFWGLSTGADEYLTKDDNAEEELFAAIQRIFTRRATLAPQESEHPISKRNSAEPVNMNTEEITEFSVLERVNQLLDHQLFQATIVNELSYLAIHMSSFPATIEAMLTLLGKVCEFRVASIFLNAHAPIQLYCYPFQPVAESFLADVQQRITQTYLKYDPTAQLDHIQVQRLNPPHDQTGKAAETVRMFFALPLQVRSQTFGVLAIAHSRETPFSADTLDTLRVFANEASIVLDNALLVNQLAQSNQELETTIMQLKNTQAQLVHSEKLASLGQLVAGIAHEINTPAGAIHAAATNLTDFLPTVPDHFRQISKQQLTPADQERFLTLVTRILASIKEKHQSTLSLRQEGKDLETLLAAHGFADVRRLARQIARFELKDLTPTLLDLLSRYQPEALLDSLENCGRIVNASKDIRLSISIITRLVNGLKMYSRIDEATVEEVDIHEGLETTLIILQSQIVPGIEVKREYGRLPNIPCYANELNQVWTNLIHNALQAMNGTGILTIETFVSPSGENIVVKITDTGPGIPEQIRDKIFDPFFTTKDQGKGSGLGLSIALQIVERHHGAIRVTSQPGATSFEVVLPIAGMRQEYLTKS